MREILEQVMELQQQYESRNTPAMRTRGLLIRDGIPNWIRANMHGVEKALTSIPGEYVVVGRDATGRKSEIPWVRFCNTNHSPNTKTGWYGVYLFESTGKAVYLSLGFGSTIDYHGTVLPKSDSELDETRELGLSLIKDLLPTDRGLVDHIDLNVTRSQHASSYEKAVPVAFRYERDSVPSERQLIKDAELIASLLIRIYETERLGRVPNSPLPETRQIERIIAPRAREEGQGYGLTADERKAVELRAMKLAEDYLKEQKFDYEDTSSTKPFDFLASKDKKEWIVEVKGTTSPGAKILLTKNEVDIHRAKETNSILIVVHSIELTRNFSKPPEATGGEITVFVPWEIDLEALTPTSYEYLVPKK